MYYIYSPIKKNEITLFAETCIELQITLLGKISQREKDKYHILSYVESRVFYRQKNKGRAERLGERREREQGQSYLCMKTSHPIVLYANL